MFAGDAAAELDAGAQRGGSSLDNTIQLARRAHIEENVWMEVAIAGVKNVGDAKIVLLTDFRDAPHYLRQLAARHHAVLDVVIWGQGAHGSKGAISPFPKKLTFGFVVRHSGFTSAVALANSARYLDCLFSLLTYSFHLDFDHLHGIARKPN